MTSSVDESPARKGEATRQRIVDAALTLFQQHGYAKTTMRAVAAAAGVSLGNAYYYFGSKDELVQSFYDQIQEQHAAAAGLIVARTTDLTQRLVEIELAWLEIARPYRDFAGSFFATAADPKNPSSPFSQQSTAARETSIGIFRAALAGSGLVVPADLQPRLPELLWLSHMGVVLHWVHDDTADERRTRALIGRVVPLGVRILKLTRRRPARPVVRQFLKLLDDVRNA